MAEALPLERVSGLLLSPYFAMAAEERRARAEFDAFELRKARMLRPEIIAGWPDRAGRRVEAEGKTWRGCWGRCELCELVDEIGLRGMRCSNACRVGGEDARVAARAAGWGPGLSESSVEFQTRRKWESALDELATLDFDGVRVEFVEALEALERIARQTMFAPESREAPVQVMGPLEAAGETFDAVWFLRGGDLSWPMETRSNPLLPWPLQRELGDAGDRCCPGQRIRAADDGTDCE